MPSLGKIEEFNSATTSINRYLERLEQYFVADNISADSAESHKRRAILISVIGAEAFWENVCTAHHYPKESFRTEETGYRRRIYQSGIHLNEALRDSFFCGLRSTETQKKLLTEEHTLDAALNVALGAEAAEKDLARKFSFC